MAGRGRRITRHPVAVAASGHPELSDLPDTIAGYAQALIRLRDTYAPDNVYELTSSEDALLAVRETHST